MKLITATLTLAIVILFSVYSQAQPDYTVSAVNGTLTDNNNFEFDIYILRVGSTPLELAGFQTSIYFNDVIRNGGTLSGTYLPGTSELSAAEIPNTPNLSYTGSGGTIHQFRIAPKVPPGAGNGSLISATAPGTKLGRFKITNTAAFNTSAAVNWQWNFTTSTGEYSSYINSYLSGINTNISNPVKFQMDLPDPLVQTTTFALTVAIQNGWNMVSIPGLHPTNQNVTTWWVNKDPGAGVFRFNAGYQAVTSVTPGTGYWMKHVGAQTYNTGDEWPAGGIQFVAHDPITAAAGWNLFGGYEQSVAAGNVTTTPAGLITGSIFKYQSGYLAATTIDPGYGYWIKLTGAGQINIPPPGAAKELNNGTEDFNKIFITDNSGKSYILYTTEEADLAKFELPPTPPQGMFDIRFSSGRYVENISAGKQVIEMSGVLYPVKVKADAVSIILYEESGKEIVRLKPGEEYSLESSFMNKLFISENIIPKEFSLEQNYPNPFNPSTSIEFSLPVASKNVKVTIYNTLGQRVTELVNTSLEAGKYTYRWEAGNAASGIYIYELSTDKFVSARKMILLR